jgi:hypothetical protein
MFCTAGGNFSFVVFADADNLAFNYASVEGKSRKRLTMCSQLIECISDPSKNSEFNLLVHELATTTYRGHHCESAPDFASLGFAAGQKLTIQAKWRAGAADTVLYQCADIELVENSDYVPEGMCFNGALTVATADNNDYSDPGPKSGLSGVSFLLFSVKHTIYPCFMLTILVSLCNV